MRLWLGGKRTGRSEWEAWFLVMVGGLHDDALLLVLS